MRCEGTVLRAINMRSCLQGFISSLKRFRRKTIRRHRKHLRGWRLAVFLLAVVVYLLAVHPPNMSMEVTWPEVRRELEPTLLTLPGGEWKPRGCTPRQKLAIVFPFRNREAHLRVILRRLHPLLQAQRIHYRIFISEQAEPTPFNRGMARNVGFLEAMKLTDFDCVAFHDIDMVPEHFGNWYLCGDHARHLSSAIDEHRYHPLYYMYMGGVLLMRPKDAYRINGYPNCHWRWGNEDDEMACRIAYSDMTISRPPYHIGRYKMMRHKKDGKFEENFLFSTWKSRWRLDGLNQLPGTYNATIKSHSTYTQILFSPNPPDYQKLKDFEKLPRVSWLWKFIFFHAT